LTVEDNDNKKLKYNGPVLLITHLNVGKYMAFYIITYSVGYNTVLKLMLNAKVMHKFKPIIKD